MFLTTVGATKCCSAQDLFSPPTDRHCSTKADKVPASLRACVSSSATCARVRCRGVKDKTRAPRAQVFLETVFNETPFSVTVECARLKNVHVLQLWVSEGGLVHIFNFFCRSEASSLRATTRTSYLLCFSHSSSSLSSRVTILASSAAILADLTAQLVFLFASLASCRVSPSSTISAFRVSHLICMASL